MLLVYFITIAQNCFEPCSDVTAVTEAVQRAGSLKLREIFFLFLPLSKTRQNDMMMMISLLQVHISIVLRHNCSACQALMRFVSAPSLAADTKFK